MAYLDLNSWFGTAAFGGNSREEAHVGGSGGILPQKMLTFLDALRCILVHSSASFIASMAQCLPDYLSQSVIYICLGEKNSHCSIFFSRPSSDPPCTCIKMILFDYVKNLILLYYNIELAVYIYTCTISKTIIKLEFYVKAILLFRSIPPNSETTSSKSKLLDISLSTDKTAKSDKRCSPIVERRYVLIRFRAENVLSQ